MKLVRRQGSQKKKTACVLASQELILEERGRKERNQDHLARAKGAKEEEAKEERGEKMTPKNGRRKNRRSG